MIEAGGVKVKILGDDSDLQSKLNKSGQDIKYWAKTSAIAIGTMGAAMATSAAIITKKTAEAAREIENFARLSNTSVEAFQAQGQAAKTVGIEYDKFADILKDMNDRVGDFISTGGGPLVDFFEQVAPKVGVTADQFRNLSGNDALQLYVSSLEKANLSQSEMVFYMEAIASDSSLLLPLLKDNGQAMGELADRADRLGAVLSSVEISQLQQLNKATEELYTIWDGFTNNMAVELAPVMTGIVTETTKAIESMGGLGNVTEKVMNSAVIGAGYVADAFKAIDIATTSMELAIDGFYVTTTWAFKSVLEAWENTVNAIIEKANYMIEGLNNLPMVDIDLIDESKLESLQFMKNMHSVALEEMMITQDEFNELMEKPWPSDSIKQWVEDVKVASKEAAEAMPAFTPSMGGDTGGEVITPQKKEELEKLREQLEQRLEIIRESFLSEDELQQEKLAKELEDLQAGFEQKLITEEDYLMSKAELEQRYMEESWQREKDYKDAKVALAEQERKDKKSAYQSMFGDLSSLMNTKSKELFAIGKAASIANAIVDGQSAAVKAYEGGLRVSGGNPAVGAAFMAASIASTGARIQQISSTNIGSSSSGGSTSFAGGTPAVTTQQAQQPSGGTLTVEGLSASSLFTGDTVSALAEELLEYQRNGGNVVLQG